MQLVPPIGFVLDTKDPLTKGLVIEAPIALSKGGVGAPQDLITGLRFSVGGSPQQRSNILYGRATDISTSGQYYYISPHPLLSSFSYMTAQIIIVRDSAGSGTGYGSMFHHNDDVNSGTTDWFSMENDNGDAGWGTRINTMYTNVERVWSIPYLTNGQWSNIVVSYDHTNSSNTPFALKNKGVEAITDRFNGGWTRTIDAKRIGIGSRAGSGSWDGGIALFRYWKRKLTPQEMWRLQADPWCFYKRRNSFSLGKVPSGTAHSSTLTDTVTLVDVLSKTPSRELTDAVTLVDSVIKTPSRTLTENVTVVDTILNTAGKVLTDVFTIVDTLVKTPGKVLTDVVTVVDTFTSASEFFRTLNEVVTIVDTVIKTPGRILTDVVTVVDTVTSASVLNATLTEIVTVVDSIVRTPSRTLSEVVTVVDTLTRTWTLGRTYEEVFTIVDTIVRAPTHVMTEVVTLVDSLIRTQSRTLSEIFSIDDVFAKIQTTTRTFTDSFSIVDTFNTNRGKFLVEVITLVDSLGLNLNNQKWYAKLRTVFRTLNPVNWYTKNNTDWEDKE